MVTDSPRIAAHESSLGDARGAAEGIGARLLDQLRQAFCGLHGHDALLQFDHDRMYLKCASCGHESPGWALTGPPPVATGGRTIEVKAEVPCPIGGHPLFDARRIA